MLGQAIIYYKNRYITCKLKICCRCILSTIYTLFFLNFVNASNVLSKYHLFFVCAREYKHTHVVALTLVKMLKWSRLVTESGVLLVYLLFTVELVIFHRKIHTYTSQLLQSHLRYKTTPFIQIQIQIRLLYSIFLIHLMLRSRMYTHKNEFRFN